jgi:hypothetical protein
MPQTLTLTSGGTTYTATPNANVTAAQQAAALSSGWSSTGTNSYSNSSGEVPAIAGHTVTPVTTSQVSSAIPNPPQTSPGTSGSTAPVTGEPGGSGIAPQQPATAQGFQNPSGVNNNPAVINPNSTIASTNPGYAATASTYNNAFNAVTSSGQAAPETGADARSAIGATVESQGQAQGPVTEAINSATQNYFQAQNNLTSYESSLQSLTALQSTLEQGAGIPQDQLSLMNIQNLMNGQQTDIENELASSGGGASEGYVEGLTTTRNKVLSQQAAQIQNQLSFAQDEVQNQMSVQESDRQQAEQQLTDNITQSQGYLSFYQNMQTQATANYQKIISSSANGYSALVQSIGNNPGALADAENFLNLAPGTLQNPQTVSSLDAAQYKLQSLNATIAKDAMQGGYYDSRTLATNASGAQSVISQYMNLPANTVFAAAQPMLSRIEGAVQTPGSVSDNDLLDAVIQLDSGGNQVTEAQVQTITGGRSYADSLDVIKNAAAAQGGVLSDSQRQQLIQIANTVYGEYQTAYIPVYDGAINALNSSGYSDYTSVVPDLNALSSVGPTGAATALSTYGQSVTIGGQSFTVGHPFTNASLPGVTLTPTAQGNFNGSDGNTYDANGDVIGK